MEDQTSNSKMESQTENDNENQVLNRIIKTENDIHHENDDRVSASDNASSLMIDSEDDSLNENEDENYDAWRATESRLSSTMDGEQIDCEEDLGISMDNKNTQRKTDTDIRIFITYLRSINEFRAPELIQPVHLDRYLSAFFSVVKKHDGNEYEPASLRGMLCSVERYLKIKNYPQSVTRDSVFVSTRNALKFKQQKLRELGKGSKKQPEPFGRLTLDKVNHLFSAREMGPYSPMSVINTLCFLFIVHFRLRKAIDHKNLLWGDIKLQTDKNGRQYLIYEPVDIQNSIAHSKYDHHGNRLCVWETPEVKERDPVTIYKLYAEKRPQNMKYENSPFYLGITSMQPTQLQSWYRTCAMGVNKLSDLVRMIRDITGLPRATMNAPSEFILSESYGIVSISNQDKALSTALLPDTKHAKVFGQNSVATGNKSSAVGFDSSNNEMFEKKGSYFSNSTCKSSEDSNNSDETVDEICSPPEGFQQNSANLKNNTTTSRDGETMTLYNAKGNFLGIMHKLNPNDMEDFRNWIYALIPQSVHTEDVKPVIETGPKEETKMATFPSITLNIKISPDAISGSNPISVVADIVPQESQLNKNVESAEKRKLEPENGASNAKRLKDGERNSPMNLSSGNIKTPNENFNRRCQSSQGNTAIVHPRSDKIDQGQHNAEKFETKQNTKITPNRTVHNVSENQGYVPISYPYLTPNCFSQDPRMLVSSNVFPRVAHTGANMPYSFIPSLRTMSKTPSQETNDPNTR